MRGIAIVGMLVCAVIQSAARRPTTPPVWHPVLERFTPAGTIQTEFGSSLNESGFRKLLAALSWKSPSERSDYYFDAYDGLEFLLRSGEAPVKVRIKVKKQKSEWQVSRFVAKDQVAVGALIIKVHTTESWQQRLDGPLRGALLAACDEFAARLDAGGTALLDAAGRVETAWQALRAEIPLPGLMVLDRALAGRPYHFYPRKVTSAKTRYSGKLPGFAAPTVSLLLGSEPEVDANGNTILTYELEAEPDGPSTPSQAQEIATAIGRWMQEAGVTADDQTAVDSLSNEYTLRQLTAARRAPMRAPSGVSHDVR